MSLKAQRGTQQNQNQQHERKNVQCHNKNCRSFCCPVTAPSLPLKANFCPSAQACKWNWNEASSKNCKHQCAVGAKADHRGKHSGSNDVKTARLLLSNLCVPSGNTSGVLRTSGTLRSVWPTSWRYDAGVERSLFPQTVHICIGVFSR